MTGICVAHLVRKSNGTTPFEKFLASYLARSAGITHDLVLIFKGFGRDRELALYESLAEGIPHKGIHIRDFGFDIGAYLKTARALNYDYFCFLNSFSVIQGDDWLRKLYSPFSRGDVGLVGATASRESAYSAAVERAQGKHARSPSLKGLRRALMLGILCRCFDPFPNPHIRSNAFVVRSDIFRSLRYPPILTKWDALRLESGKRGLTRQIIGAGLRALVVGKNGETYEEESWHKSGTFRMGNQGNLLIADNQTDAYIHGDHEAQRRLSQMAWGDDAS